MLRVWRQNCLSKSRSTIFTYHFIIEDKGKGRGERRRSLNAGECDFPDDVRVSETEDSFYLVECHAFLYADHVLVERWALSGNRIVTKKLIIHINYFSFLKRDVGNISV